MVKGQNTRRYLWTRGGALGDFILALPSLQELARRGPVTAVVPRRYLPLLQGYPVEVREEEHPAWARLYQGGEQAPLPFDVAVVLRSDGEGALREGLRSAGVGEVWYVDSQQVDDPALHVIWHLLRGVGVTGEGDPPAPRLFLREDEREEARRLLASRGMETDRMILLQPGSGGQAKRWPEPLWRELGECLQQRGFELLLSLGPVEWDEGEGERWRQGPWRLIPPLGLREQAALQSLGVVVGCDSGTTHLAAAVGARVVALFGPTDPRRWRPAGPQVRVVQAPGVNMASLPVAYTLAAVLEVSRAPRPQLHLGVA